MRCVLNSEITTLKSGLHLAGEQHLFLGQGAGKNIRDGGAKNDRSQIDQGEKAYRDTQPAQGVDPQHQQYKYTGEYEVGDARVGDN